MSSKLIYYYGAMGCGKTRELLKTMHSKEEDGFSIVVMKPLLDKKGGDRIESRDKSGHKVDFLIDNEENIYEIIASYLRNNNLDFILVDEVQFLRKHHIDELSDVVDLLDISVICYGLRTDFKGELFEGAKRLFEIADDIIELERQCSCGEKKIYNMRLEGGIPVFDGEQIAIDGVDATYEAKCRKCYKNMKRKYNGKIENVSKEKNGFRKVVKVIKGKNAK